MRFLHSPFSNWVMPLRLAGGAITVYGLIRMMAVADFTAIAMAVAGSLVWQAGTLLEERSPLFLRFANTPVSKVMRSRFVPVASWWTLAKMRSQFPTIDDQSFFVTTENGYLTGVALSEWIWGASNDEARYRRMEEISRPIEYVDAVRQDDTALAAFSRMKLLRRNHLSVTDARETLVGVITREQIADFLHGSAASQVARDTAVQLKVKATGVNDKIAA